MKCPFCGHPKGDKPHTVYRHKGRRRKRCRGHQKNRIVPLVETDEERWGHDVLVFRTKKRRA